MISIDTKGGGVSSFLGACDVYCNEVWRRVFI